MRLTGKLSPYLYLKGPQLFDDRQANNSDLGSDSTSNKKAANKNADDRGKPFDDESGLFFFTGLVGFEGYWRWLPADNYYFKGSLQPTSTIGIEATDYSFQLATLCDKIDHHPRLGLNEKGLWVYTSPGPTDERGKIAPAARRTFLPRNLQLNHRDLPEIILRNCSDDVHVIRYLKRLSQQHGLLGPTYESGQPTLTYADTVNFKNRKMNAKQSKKSGPPHILHDLIFGFGPKVWQATIIEDNKLEIYPLKPSKPNKFNLAKSALDKWVLKNKNTRYLDLLTALWEKVDYNIPFIAAKAPWATLFAPLESIPLLPFPGCHNFFALVEKAGMDEPQVKIGHQRAGEWKTFCREMAHKDLQLRMIDRGSEAHRLRLFASAIDRWSQF